MILLAALAIAQTAARPIWLLGATPDQVRSLGTYLGSNYEVRLPQTASRAPGQHTTIVLLPPTPKEERDFDGYVPRLRQNLIALRSQSNTVFVVVPANQASDPFSAYVGPLTRQAAREAGVKTIELSGASFEEAVGESIVDPRIEKKGWKVVSFDSQQIDEGTAAMAIDGNPDTYWHTQYDPTTPKHPHQIVVDMGKSQTFNGFRYVPRQDGGVNGRVKGFEFYASTDGQSWGTPVATGELANTNKPVMFRFTGPVTARYFRFVATSEQNRGPWTTIAEIDVLRVRP